MSYRTELEGQILLTPKLTPEQVHYLNKFSSTRRMKRDSSIAERMSDPIREAVKLPIGHQGEYCVRGEEFANYDDSDDSIVDSNCPPESQPGLWCHWTSNDEGTAIEWDGGDNFSDYEEWLDYMIQHFLEPWGIVANGTIQYQGEEPSDQYEMIVKNNKIGN